MPRLLLVSSHMLTVEEINRLLYLGEGVEAVLQTIDPHGQSVADGRHALEQGEEGIGGDAVVDTASATLVDAVAEVGDVVSMQKEGSVDGAPAEVGGMWPVWSCHVCARSY